VKYRLAVAHDDESASPFQIVNAVGDCCDLIWVVDSSRAEPIGPMLPRLGTVVDIAGLDPDAANEKVARFEPEGIVAFSDSQLATASLIAAGLGLRFNRPEVTALFLDKYEQRRALRAADITVPNFIAIPAGSSAASIRELAADVTFPAVLKPRFGCGSRDTSHVTSAAELIAGLQSVQASRTAAEEDYLAEEYIPGIVDSEAPPFADYVSVESVSVAGCTRHVGVTGRFPLAEPYRETGNFTPSPLSPHDKRAVKALAGRVLAALGVEYGCFHTEIKLTPTGPRVIESNARVGGGGIDDIFVMTSGDSLLRLAALAALGLESPGSRSRRKHAVAYQLFVQPPRLAHRLIRMDGLEQVTALPGVAQISINRRAGDETDWHQGSQGYVLSVRGLVSDHEALSTLRSRVLEKLVLEYE
jgi:biotin carboxylase